MLLKGSKSKQVEPWMQALTGWLVGLMGWVEVGLWCRCVGGGGVFETL